MTAVVGQRSSGSERGDRRSARDKRVDKGVPPWRGWRTKSRSARAIRWIETYCRIPSGHGAGKLMRLAPFQKRILEVTLEQGVRTAGVQIPRGNGKSTLWAAVGLWALCDYPDTPQVPLVGFNGKQVMRTLLDPAVSMVHANPELDSRLVVYNSTNDRRIWSGWNDGSLIPIPAEVDRLQGLNPTLALVDEAQTVTPEVWTTVLQGAGKRPESLVLAIGNPSPMAQASALFELRARAEDGARVAWVEFAADPGCEIDDRVQWAQANPALEAGILYADVLEDELRTVSEPEFRMKRLGQWIDATFTDWLPGAAWDDCPHADPPPNGADVVLALAGTGSARSIAIVGCTPDGATFYVWASDDPRETSDDQLAGILDAQFGRWNVLGLVVAARQRPNLVASLTASGWPVEVWARSTNLEVMSSDEWRRAILEGRVAHDHHPTLAAHVSALVARNAPDGSLRLEAGDDGTICDAGQAARLAWWTAIQADTRPAPAIY